MDAPSGTALAIAEGISAASSGERNFVYGRYGTDAKRQPGEIGIHAVRGGNIVGEHQVLFIGPSDVLEITHKAQSKQVFALGSMRAAAFLCGKPAGLYDMNDMIAQTNTRVFVSSDSSKALISVDACPPEAVFTVLDALAGAGISYGPVSHASSCLRIVINRGDAAAAEQCLGVSGLSSHVRRDICLITVSGIDTNSHPVMASQAYRLVADGTDIELFLISGDRLSLCVPSADAETAAKRLSESL